MGLIYWLALLAPGAITGDYIEDRANKVYGCYCEWSGEGEYAGREAVLGWRIREGAHRGVDLAGVKIVAVIHGDRTLSRPGAVRRSILLIDAAAPERRSAAEALMRHYADLLGEIIAIHDASIEMSRGPSGASIRIAGLLSVEMRKARPVEDSLPGAVPWYPPFIPLEAPVLGTTLHTGYTGPDFNHRWIREDAGVTGYYGPFRLEPR
jgi:hypothetical protein